MEQVKIKCPLDWQFVILFYIYHYYMFQHQRIILRELLFIAC
jgi:hypothetical protein